MTTSVPRNESELMQYRVLERANLLQYFDMFISQGGDDVRQLCEAGEDEFLEIMALVGMASKPLHVRRLQKALQEWLNYPAKFQQPYLDSGHQKMFVKDEPFLRNNNSVFPCVTETISQASQTGITVSHDDKLKLSDSVKFMSKNIKCEPNLEIMDTLNFTCPITDIEGLFVTSDLSTSQIELIANQSEQLINSILNERQDLIREAGKLLCINIPALLTNRELLLENCLKVVMDSGFDLKKVSAPPSGDKNFDESFSLKDRIKELDDNISLLTNRKDAIVGTDAASRDNIAAIQTLLNNLTADRNEMLKCNKKQHPKLTAHGLTTMRDGDENSMKIAKMDTES